MKNIGTFFKKTALLLVLFCLLDFLSGLVLKIGFFKQKSGKYFTTSHCLQNAKEDIMIFGNSHANEHLNSLLMEEDLKLSTFNFGNQSQSLLYQYVLIKTVLQKQSPKIIVVVLDYNTLKYRIEDYQKLSIFLPYRGLNKYVDSSISSIDQNEWYKSFSSLYRYNSTLGYMYLSVYKSTYNKSYNSRGFDPTSGTLCDKEKEKENNKGQITTSQSDLKLDSVKIKYLTNIIDELDSKKIKAIFVTTPLYYFPNVNEDLYFTELKRILSSKKAIYLNFTRDSSFERKCNLFNSSDHLNEVGARIFTKCMIEKIRPLL